MAQIFTLYEPPQGAPWWLPLFYILLFLFALLLPFLIRYVILRRPVINLWSAIPLTLICSIFIAFNRYILFPTNPSIGIDKAALVGAWLFIAFCIYSYCIMHKGYRDYCIQKLIADETDKKVIEMKNKFIWLGVVLAAVVAGISIGLVVEQILSIHSEAQSKLQRKQQEYAEQYMPALPDGYSLEYLPPQTVSKLRASGFSDKRIQDYKEILQDQKGFWVNLSLLGLVALCGVIGLFVGTVVFVIVWSIYLVLERVVLGFCDNNRLKLTIRRLTGLLPFIVPVVMRVFHNCSAMNKKHKIIWIGIAVVVLMCIFPPWIRVIELEGSRAYHSIGYHFLLAPPKSKGIESYSIDLGRLIIQCVIVSLITGGLLYTLRTEQSNRE